MEHNLVIYSSTYRDDYIFDGITLSYDHTRYGLLHIYLWHICSIASALLAAATSQQNVIRDRAIFFFVYLLSISFVYIDSNLQYILNGRSVNHSQVTTPKKTFVGWFHPYVTH